MSRPRDSLIWGAVVLLAGAALLVWNLGVLSQAETTAAWVVVALFSLLGLAFVFSYLNKRQDWWRLIPAFTLLGVAAAVFLLTRGVAPAWAATALLVGVDLAFVVIYASDRHERWWALIPFGSVAVMVTLILVSELPAASPTLLGAILLGGMSLVFFLIYALAGERRRFGWALVPTAVLGVMALAALAAHVGETSPAAAEGIRLWPVLLVLGGVALIGFGIARSTRSVPPALEMPAQPTPAETPIAPGASVTTLSDGAAPAKPAGRTGEQPGPGEVDDIYQFLKSAPPEDTGGTAS